MTETLRTVLMGLPAEDRRLLATGDPPSHENEDG